MDELVHTIENAAAKVDGAADIAEKAATPVKEVVTDAATNGKLESESSAAPAVAVVPEEAEKSSGDEKKEDVAAPDATVGAATENGVSTATETPAVVEETPAAPETQKTTTVAENEATPAVADTKDVEASVAVTESAEATTTETAPVESVPVPEATPAVVEPPTSTTEVDSAVTSSTTDAPPAAETVPVEVTPAPVVVEEEKMDVSEDVKIAVPEPTATEASVIDLDTTLETTMETAVIPEQKPSQTAPAVEDKTDAVVVLDDESVLEDSVAVAEITKSEPVEEKKPEQIAAEAEPEKDAPSAMEVTIDDSVADKTLETPNVSICPIMDKPQLLANNRISELVLSNGSSTPNTTNPTSVEFQATPIKKAISIEEKLMEMEAEDDTKSTTDVSSSCQEISSKSSSDGGMKRLQETLKQVNGTTTPDCSSSAAESVSQSEEKTQFGDLTDAATPENMFFDTVVNFQNGMLQCLMVDRVIRPVVPAVTHAESSDASSEKSASNGSTTSLGPFALPGALTHTGSGLSVSSISSAGVAGEKTRIQGVSGLRTFLQDLLKKLPEEEKKKPAGRGRGRASNSAAATNTPVKAAPATPTRTTATSSPKVTEAAAGSAKKQVAFATTTSTESQVGNFVMARWSDRKYYAGRVSAEKPGNKFQIRFEDGAQRTLARDQLVFGDKNVAMALKDREVNVLVEANVYETGLVVSIDTEACTYSVMTNSGSVTVPASDLYLDEDQAKQVQLAMGGEAGAGSSTAADAGSSGATTASGRRKRNSDLVKSSPEAGPSNVSEPAAKKSRKR